MATPPALPVATEASTSTKPKPNPFGAARPREDNLKSQGVDPKAMDEKLEDLMEQLPSTMTAEEKEKYKELADALTELQLKVDAEGISEEDREKAAKELSEKQKEKREFVKSLRRTKVKVGRYQPPRSGNGPRGGHHNGRPRHQHQHQHDNENNSKLYVGDLDSSVTDEILGSAFGMFGHVQDAEVCKHRETGYSRGYGFVTMERPEQAHRALISLSESGGSVPFQRSPVRVNYANNRRRGDGRGGDHHNNYRGGSQGGYGRQFNNRGGWNNRRNQYDSNGRQEAFQNFGSNQRYRNNQQGGYNQPRGGGYSNNGYDRGRQGGYNRGGDRYGNGGNYRNDGRSPGRNHRGGAGNWQQQKDRGYNNSRNFEDQGDHAMMDRMLEGDMMY